MSIELVKKHLLKLKNLLKLSNFNSYKSQYYIIIIVINLNTIYL